MNQYKKQIDTFIKTHKDEMLQKWGQLVNLESHFDEKENVEKAQIWLQKELEGVGFKCYVRDSIPTKAGVLVGILGEERKEAPVIFSGHIDTVHKTGSFGKENPFQIEDGKAYGPGVLDMKGGIIIALYVVKALESIGYNERPIKVIFAGEEESDHIGNDIDKFFTEQSKGAVCAFNMETGHIENKLCVGRKTQYTFFITVKGLGGHAGNEFTKGRNAIHEAVHIISEMMNLTDLDKGTTVTASVIHSGSNTSSIPDLCELAIDVRVASLAEGKTVLKHADEIITKTHIEGTTIEYKVDFAKLPPFEPTEKVMRLFDFVNQVAASNGFPKFGQIRLGGASDAGNIALADIPLLCSCGVIGEYNHNIREYAVVQSLFDRVKIYTIAVTELKTLEQQLNESTRNYVCS